VNRRELIKKSLAATAFLGAGVAAFSEPEQSKSRVFSNTRVESPMNTQEFRDGYETAVRHMKTVLASINVQNPHFDYVVKTMEDLRSRDLNKSTTLFFYQSFGGKS
jgi:hypothetical protein